MTIRAPEPLAEQHIIAGFDCGRASLNAWLIQCALRNQTSGASRTFVACDDQRVGSPAI